MAIFTSAVCSRADVLVDGSIPSPSTNSGLSTAHNRHVRPDHSAPRLN